LARAQIVLITSSFSFINIYKILKVAFVISSCLTYGSSSIFGKFLIPTSSHFLNKKNNEGPVYNFKRNAFFLRISMICPNSSRFLTPVWGNITYPLKLQYWQPIWNSLEATSITCKSGFFLFIKEIVFWSSFSSGIVADAKIVNFGG